MRGLKVRIWDDFEKEYVDEWVGINKKSTDLFQTLFASEYQVIEQSTGIKDKNGVEIFEGDVIDIHQTVNGCNLFSIEWDKTKWIARYHMDTFRVYEYDFGELLDVDVDKEIEVVGNIHV